VSTRQESDGRVATRPTRVGKPARLGPFDPVEAVALVARSRRDLLLAAHRHRLSREDLEDCYSQATLELLTRAGRRGVFAGYAHIANALEQRLLSRIHDRRRALSGRSPIEAAIATALPLAACEGGGVEIADARADVERLALLRQDLRRIGQISRELSRDQRMVLASQLSSDMECDEFCRTHGWSAEKYRKVAQRARARLTRLLAAESYAGQTEPSARGAQQRDGRAARSADDFDSPVPLAGARRIREQGHTYEHHSPPT
jgi:DNA-directed RNA polymerase specialized sigma24 family protein